MTKKDPPEPRQIPSLTELFTVFATMSLSGFGGVIAWAQLILVEQRRWLTQPEFNELFALSQFLPGPNIVNLAVVFGSRLRGPSGAVAALVGLMGPPVIIVTALGIAYTRYSDVAALRGALAGVAAAAAGMLIAVVAKMARPMLAWPAKPDLLIAAVAFAAIGVMRWPLPWVILALVPASIALSFWVRR